MALSKYVLYYAFGRFGLLPVLLKDKNLRFVVDVQFDEF
jgi:hypothetical protein